jgi:hypothetical protein
MQASRVVLRIKTLLYLKQSDYIEHLLRFFCSNEAKTIQEWNESQVFEIVDLEFQDATNDAPNVKEVMFYMGPETNITVYAEQYRLVFILDISSTLLSIDVESKAKVNLSMAFETYICFVFHSLEYVNASMDYPDPLSFIQSMDRKYL